MSLPASEKVLAARISLDEAVAKRDAISVEYPKETRLQEPPDYPINPVWVAYTHQSCWIDIARKDLCRAVQEHYEEMTGVSCRERPKLEGE
jgi:hypothetical protein